MRRSLCVLVAGTLVIGPSLAMGSIVGPAPTFSEQFADCDVALFVKLISSKPAGKDLFGRKTPAKSTLEVVEVVRDPKHLFKVGQTLTRDSLFSGPPGSTYLILTFPPDGESLRSLTPAGLKYLKQAPAPKVAVTSRLKFFVSFLEDPDPGVASDAFQELANAEYKDLAAIKTALPRDKLRQWVTGPAAVTGQRLGLEGIIAGYLLLRKEAGLLVIEKSKFANAGASFPETFAGMQGVRFMATFERNVIPLDRLKASMRVLLDRPEFADMAIGDLARWKDWSVMGRLTQLDGTPGYNTPAFRRAVIRYLFKAQRDRPKDPKADPPAHVAKAQASLEELKRQDPKLYRDVERFLEPEHP